MGCSVSELTTLDGRDVIHNHACFASSTVKTTSACFLLIPESKTTAQEEFYFLPPHRRQTCLFGLLQSL